jgi:hypothetical protein
VIRHRGTSSNDTDPSDGFLDLAAQDASYFSGGSFGSTLDLAGGGDYLRILNSSGNQVHGLGYDSSPGSSWTGQSSSNKALLHNNTASSGEAVFVCPGSTISDYFGNCSSNCFEHSTSKTSKNSTHSQGLPNTCSASSTANTSFWLSIREPVITNQTYSQSVIPAATIVLTFTGSIDAVSSDNTQGYLVLRNTSNSFTNPADGTSYSIGTILGTATVVANADNTVNGGLMSISVNSISGADYYKIFAYQFGDDNLNGNNFHSARGRAYNTNQSVSITISSITPLPFVLDDFEKKTENEQIIFSWSTKYESDLSGFEIEKSVNGKDFESIQFIKALNESWKPQTYEVRHRQLEQIAYYRLKIIEKKSNPYYSKILVSKLVQNDEKISISPNPFYDKISLELPDNLNHKFFLMDIHGTKLYEYQTDSNQTNLELTPTLNQGIYFLRIQSELIDKIYKIIKID